MSMGDWDALAPVGAIVAIGVLVAMSATDRAPTMTLDQRQRVLEQGISGQPVPWGDTERGPHGLMVPDAIVTTADGSLCRSYTVTASIDGGPDQAMRHVACRVAEGIWRDRAEPSDGQIAAAPN